MVKLPSHQLRSRRSYRGEKAGKALAKWLNKPAPGLTFKWMMQPASGHSLIQELLIDAQAVFFQLAKYKSRDQFSEARRKKKLPPQFAKSYDRLNGMLGSFTHAPRIELDGIYEGPLVSWMLSDDSPLALLSTQVRWVLDVINQGAILKIRRCQQCDNWFFARFSHQTFCKKSCQNKDFSQTEDFKAKRSKYMRDYRSR